MDDPALMISVIGMLIMSLSVHEAAHAWTASLLGDPTGKDLGRITLNPIKHIDPVISILVPGLLLYLGLPVLAGAKPVPVNVSNFKHPARDFMLVAIMGPISNVVIGFVMILALNIAHGQGWLGESRVGLLWSALAITISLNFLLAFFNMMPVPPLDGSRVVAFFLPGPLRRGFQKLDYVGFFLIFGLIYFEAFDKPYFFFVKNYDAYIRPLMP